MDTGESEIFLTNLKILITNEEIPGKDDDKEENNGETMKPKGDTVRPME